MVNIFSGKEIDSLLLVHLREGAKEAWGKSQPCTMVKWYRRQLGVGTQGETGQALGLIGKDRLGPLRSEEPRNGDKLNNMLGWHCRWSF